jgi:hypothetical protein
MTAVVEAESLTKRFGEVPAVTDLSFALEACKQQAPRPPLSIPAGHRPLAAQLGHSRPRLLRYFCAVRRGALWDCPAGHYPLHRLAGDTRDQIEVAVVVEHGHAFPLSHGGGH